MNTFVIRNPDATSECFSHFRGMRGRRERIDILLQATLKWVVNAAVEYAYGGVERLSTRNAVKLYHLAHILQNKALIDGCTEFIIANIERIEKEDVGDAWLAANASKNEDLMKACAPLVAMNWELFRVSRLFHVNTEITGMMALLNCHHMTQISWTSKVKALSTWRSSSRDDKVREARTNALKNIIPLLGVQDSQELLSHLEAEGVDIPFEWRKWLAKKRGGKISERCIQCGNDEYLGQLAAFKFEEGDGERWNTVVRIFNAECFGMKTELKLPDRNCRSVVSIRDHLVFVGGWESKESRISNRVELMNVWTGKVYSLPNMICDRLAPACAVNKGEIFVFSDLLAEFHRGAFSSEVYEAASGRWSPLPQMIEDRRSCAAVSIPDCGVLVIGGYGRNYKRLRSTELLTWWSGEGGREGDEKWQWCQFPPMNEKHKVPPFAVYWQEVVYVVGKEENVDSMEMLDVAGRQWTSLTSFGPIPFLVDSMAAVGDRLFVRDFDSSSLYSTELEGKYVLESWSEPTEHGVDSMAFIDSSAPYPKDLEVDPKRQHEKLQRIKKVDNVEIQSWQLTAIHI